MGVTVGDEVMVFLSRRLLKGALSPRSCLFVSLEGCVWLVSVESLERGPTISDNGSKLTGGCKTQLLRRVVR